MHQIYETNKIKESNTQDVEINTKQMTDGYTTDNFQLHCFKSRTYPYRF